MKKIRLPCFAVALLLLCGCTNNESRAEAHVKKRFPGGRVWNSVELTNLGSDRFIVVHDGKTYVVVCNGLSDYGSWFNRDSYYVQEVK